VTLADVAAALADEVDRLRFGAPVAYVYNPLRYAQKPHVLYLEKYGRAPKEIILLGMNPGPFGMAQTGVPFGDVTLVRDWLGIEADVEKPPREHPKRPVLGFDTKRSEVSGTRLWGWARTRFATPKRFFARFFVMNYCPLAFLESSGKNRTPDQLPAVERQALTESCDEALRSAVALLRPTHVIGVGTFARVAAERALRDMTVEVGCMLHPSPASPRANRDWAGAAERDLVSCGIDLSPVDRGAAQ
jgi:single-strand selective monofunctional uracil DNA glycosylase